MDSKIKEAVNTVSINKLKNFKDYPFLIKDNQSMADLVLSIREYGVITPLTVIPADDGKFEIISGHRRKRACELAGISEIPILIKHLSRDEAIIMMVDSNLQREEILPSEKSRAYSMKMEAVKRKKGRPTLEEQGEEKFGKSINTIAESSPDSATQIQRYIRLNNLIPAIMEMVDDKKIGLTTAVELSYLNTDEQDFVKTSIDTEGPPSRSQAQRLKKLSKEGNFNEDTAFTIMQEQKKPESFNVVIPYEKISKYFSKNCSPVEIAERLLALCERLYQQNQKKKQHSNER